MQSQYDPLWGSQWTRITLFNEQDREEQVETVVYLLCFESMRKWEMLHFDTEWVYKHFIFNISVSSRGRERRRLNLQLPVK